MATISVPTTRQFQLSLVSTFTYEDCVGAAVVNLFGVQVGSKLTYINLTINTSFAGGTTHDADFGDVTDPDEYSATVVELDGTALAQPANPPALTGFVTTSAEPNVTLSPVSTGGDPTSGSADLYVSYIVKGRAHENYET